MTFNPRRGLGYHDFDEDQATMTLTRRELVKGFICTSATTALDAQTSSGRDLKSYLGRCGGYLGAVSDRSALLGNDLLRNLIVRNFNMLTPEGSLRWGSIRRSEDIFSFWDSDWVVKFCHENNLAVHGHNLCTNVGNPPWLELSINKYNARHLLTDHIKMVMGRYKGQIVSWDVVNEPIATWFNRPDGMYTGPWLSALGPEYIDIAFQTAYETDPKSLRVMNIHHVEQDGPDALTRQKALALIRGLVSRGVPIQAVGLESHLDAARPLGGDDLHRFIKEIVQLGLKILITELDVSDIHIKDGSIVVRDAAVAKTYFDYLTAIYAATDPQQLSFWSVTDNNWIAWIARTSPAYRRADGLRNRAGLLDRELQQKPAWFAVQRFLSTRHC